MDKLLDVEIKLTKSGFVWSSPTIVKVYNVPPKEYETLLELMLEWAKKFTEPKK
jgi:hypothetical protein